jgi:tRNA(fMet)-specific endonuclease VapC
MAGKYVLDTSIVVDLLRDVQAIRSRVGGALGVCISAAVLGELLYGARRSSKREQSLQEIEQFLLDCPVLICDAKTAGFYSLIRAGLAEKGKPIPDNDIWIAASAMQFGLTLAHRDAHFDLIDALDAERW